MPVREIADPMGDSDEYRRQSLLTAHLERLELRFEQTLDAVRALRRLIDPAADQIEVEVRDVSASVVASITALVDADVVLDGYATPMADLVTALSEAGATPAGASGALIDHGIFTADRGRLTVFVPTLDPPTAGRVVPMTVPAARMAVATHHGNHSDIDVTYGRLARWVLAQGFEIGGPVREMYLVGPRDTPEVEAWRTEIGWPVTV